MSEIQFRGVVKRFNDNLVIPQLDLLVPSGCLTVLLGPSGCGKSTILRMIAGLESPDEGAILLDNIDITAQEPRHRNMAMVFQNYALYPHLSVRENLAFPLKVAKMPKETITAKVTETAQLLGLTPMLDRYPRTLSGGERQRTAVGRAIIRNPQVFLFDEPLSNLDFQLRNQMRGELKSLQQRLGKTTVYVTHDQTEAMTMADNLVVLNQGRVMQIGSPSEVFRKPANLFVARFIGSPPMNIINVEVASGICYPLGQKVPLAKLEVANGKYLLGVRPDQLLLGPNSQDAHFTVERTEFHGTATFLIGKIGDDLVMATSPADRTIAVGERVTLDFISRNLHLFDAASGTRIPF